MKKLARRLLRAVAFSAKGAIMGAVVGLLEDPGPRLAHSQPEPEELSERPPPHLHVVQKEGP